MRSEVTFYSLQHTATSLLKNTGVSEAVAREIIGQKSAAISQYYTHIDKEAKRKALAKLPDVTVTPKKQRPNRLLSTAANAPLLQRANWLRVGISQCPAQEEKLHRTV